MHAHRQTQLSNTRDGNSVMEQPTDSGDASPQGPTMTFNAV